MGKTKAAVAAGSKYKFSATPRANFPAYINNLRQI